jgi:hypothetical protein
MARVFCLFAYSSLVSGAQALTRAALLGARAGGPRGRGVSCLSCQAPRNNLRLDLLLLVCLASSLARHGRAAGAGLGACLIFFSCLLASSSSSGRGGGQG